MEQPLIATLETEASLDRRQAEGVLGMILVQLQNVLDSRDYARVRDTIPDAPNLIHQAPRMQGGGLLGGLAGSLGGQRAKILMELNQGMKNLRIPSSKNRLIVDVLHRGVKQHHPELLPLVEKLTS